MTKLFAVLAAIAYSSACLISFGDGSYVFHPVPKTWSDAEAACKAEGMELVQTQSWGKFVVVLALISEHGGTTAWTNGLGDVDGLHYVWNHSGEVVDIEQLEEICDGEDVFGKALVIEREGLFGNPLKTPIPYVCEK